MLNGASTAARYGDARMVDYFSLALTHGLMALALLRLIMRAELDRDPVPEPAEPLPVAEPAEEEPQSRPGSVPRLRPREVRPRA